MTDELGRTIEALLFLSPEPVAPAELAEAVDVDEEAVAGALDELEKALEADGRARGHPGSRGRRPQAAGEAKDPAAHPGAGRGARDRRLPAAGVSAGDRPDPRGLV